MLDTLRRVKNGKKERKEKKKKKCMKKGAWSIARFVEPSLARFLDFSRAGLHTRRKGNEKVTEIMRAVEAVEVSGCLEADCLLLYGIDAVFLDHALEVPDHLLRNTLPHQ